MSRIRMSLFFTVIWTIFFILATPRLNAEESEKSESLKIYGFAKADYKYATGATTFFGTEGVRKPNFAKRATESDDNSPRSAFQANQSRIGVNVEIGKKASAIIETDFDNNPGVDNTAVGDYLRLRQANLTYKFTPSFEMFAGKKWDLFSPLVPKTYSVTSILYGVGNVGWLRDQAGVHFRKKTGDSTYFGIQVAVGNVGKDGSIGPNNTVVHNKSPLGIMQIYYKKSMKFELYLSGIGGKVLYKSADLESSNSLADPLQDINSQNPNENTLLMPAKVRAFAGGVSIGILYKFGDKLELTGEFQKGTNLGDLYALGISKMTAKTEAERLDDTVLGIIDTPELNYIRNNMLWTDYQSTHETSGWICFGLKPNATINFNLFFGASKIDNPEYLSSAKGDLTLSGGASYPGDVKQSHLFGGNVSKNLSDSFMVYFEYNYLKTEYHESERTKGVIANIASYNPYTGAVIMDVKNPIVKDAIQNTFPLVTFTENKYNLYTNDNRADPIPRSHIFNFGVMLKF